MAKKKNSPVVYSAPNADISQIVEEKLQQIPPYEDGGVKYQGYSRKLVSQGSYRLIPQNKIIIHNTITGTTEANFYTIPEGKKLCISSAIIGHLAGAGTNAFYVTDGDSGVIPPQRIQFYYRFNGDNLQNLKFEPVLELVNALWIGQIAATTDFTFYAWLEDL